MPLATHLWWWWWIPTSTNTDNIRIYPILVSGQFDNMKRGLMEAHGSPGLEDLHGTMCWLSLNRAGDHQWWQAECHLSNVTRSRRQVEEINRIWWWGNTGPVVKCFRWADSEEQLLLATQVNQCVCGCILWLVQNLEGRDFRRGRQFAAQMTPSCRVDSTSLY